MEYRVELDVYNGPLDLLLYLIRRDELDIYDIPITRILDSYMEYMEMLRGMEREEGLDINVAGEFLVMAATLMEIKSAMLLPKQPAATGEGSSAAEELADPAPGTGSAIVGIQEAQGLRRAASTETANAGAAIRAFPRAAGGARR